VIPNPPAREAFDALVAVVQAVRSEWDAAGIRFGIKQALAREEATTFAQLATVALKCAANEKCQTPATFGFDASWAEKTNRATDPKEACWTCGMSEHGHNLLNARTADDERHPFINYEDHIARMANGGRALDDKR
jgi:hypothetical protein